MPFNSELEKTPQQKFSADAPVVNLVESVDYIFKKLGVSDEWFRNPSCLYDRTEKVAGMTNTYLQPTRIGRKIVIGEAVFFYGRKFNLTPKIFETLQYDIPADVLSFVEKRIRETLTDYMSIHIGNFRLNMDINGGIIEALSNIGFEEPFKYLSINTVLTISDLEKMIQSLLEIS